MNKILMLIIILLGLWFIVAYHVKAESPTTPPIDIKEYAAMRVQDEFGGGQWESFDYIITRESRWNHLAKNPHSSAFGLGQFLSSTFRAYGTEPTSDPHVQIELAISYMRDRYESPNKAKEFWLLNHWY